MDLPPRGIIYDHEFEEQLSALIFDPEIAEGFVSAAKEMLSHLPESGMPVSEGRRIWYLPMSPVRGRRVSLFYDFDAETVTFLAILPFDD
jgi:hypothetical protein